MPAGQLINILKRPFAAIRLCFLGIANQSERTLFLGTVLVASMVSTVTGFVLMQYFSVDVLSSLISPPDDCWLGLPINIGRHCFNDYAVVVAAGSRSNPWEAFPYLVFGEWKSPPNNYPAAAMVPQMSFGWLGNWLGMPRLGLLGYLTALTIACLTPAAWAARGAVGLERIVVFFACGIAAIPAWIAIDRGNSVGFLAPIMLAFLVALCRQRWGLAAVMVILAALVKPHFALLAVVLFAARQWRAGTIAVIGTSLASLVAFLLWPQGFPGTIGQSLRGLFGYGKAFGLFDINNVSFARTLLVFSEPASSGSLIGYVILALAIVAVLVLGRRMPPVLGGVVLLAVIPLAPAVAYSYYLIFAVPVAALIVRDPQGPLGSGIFDGCAARSDCRRGVGVCVALSAALSLALIVIPIGSSVVGASEPGVLGIVRTVQVFTTTATLTPLMWLATCCAIIVSYGRRPASSAALQ